MKKPVVMIGARPNVRGGMKPGHSNRGKRTANYQEIVLAANKYLEARGMPLMQHNARNPDGPKP